MDYEEPTLEVIESAAQLIQSSVGPRYDGDGYFFSQGCCYAPLEQEAELE